MGESLAQRQIRQVETLKHGRMLLKWILVLVYEGVDLKENQVDAGELVDLGNDG